MRIAGRFAYRATATMADRGRVRKERFEPGAFRFAVEDPERDVHLLRGHSFDQPLASKRAGSLVLEDSDDALTFEAVIPPADEQPTFMADTVRMIRAGLVGGLSPGFRVPPKDVGAGRGDSGAGTGQPGRGRARHQRGRAVRAFPCDTAGVPGNVR